MELARSEAVPKRDRTAPARTRLLTQLEITAQLYLE